MLKEILYANYCVIMLLATACACHNVRPNYQRQRLAQPRRPLGDHKLRFVTDIHYDAHTHANARLATGKRSQVSIWHTHSRTLTMRIPYAQHIHFRSILSHTHIHTARHRDGPKCFCVILHFIRSNKNVDIFVPIINLMANCAADGCLWV